MLPKSGTNWIFNDGNPKDNLVVTKLWYQHWIHIAYSRDGSEVCWLKGEWDSDDIIVIAGPIVDKSSQAVHIFSVYGLIDH